MVILICVKSGFSVISIPLLPTASVGGIVLRPDFFLPFGEFGGTVGLLGGLYAHSL